MVTPSASTSITSVFVYGSLKQGEYNHPVACRAGQLIVTPAVLWNHQLFDLGPYPAMVFGRGRVYGQLLDFGDRIDRALFLLDGLEGFRGYGHRDNFYNRVEVEVVPTEDKTAPLARCWTYLFNQDLRDAERLINGHWPKIKTANIVL